MSEVFVVTFFVWTIQRRCCQIFCFKYCQLFRFNWFQREVFIVTFSVLTFHTRCCKIFCLTIFSFSVLTESKVLRAIFLINLLSEVLSVSFSVLLVVTNYVFFRLPVVTGEDYQIFCSTCFLIDVCFLWLCLK